MIFSLMNKVIITSVVLTVLAIGGIFMLLRADNAPSSIADGGTSNISVIDGKQVIRINAKGGYAPRITTARADMPTVIEVQTNGTYDCSLALTVPVVGFRKNLPASGITPIEIPPQQPGSTVRGVCTMGMYHFAVNFN